MRLAALGTAVVTRLVPGGSKSLWVVGASLVVSLLSVVGGILIARSLGPAGRGAVSGVVVVSQVTVWTLTLGMARANTYFLNHASVGEAKKSALLVNSLLYSALAGVAAGAIVVRLFLADLTASAAAPIIITTLIAAMLAGDFVNNLLLASRGYRGYGVKRIAETLVYVVLLGGLWSASRMTASAALTALLAASVAAILLGIFLLARRGFVLARRPEPRLLGPVVRYGLRAQLSDAPRFMSQFLPQLVVLPLLGVEAFGFYSVATAIAGLSQMVAGPVSSVFLSESAGASQVEVRTRVMSSVPRLLIVLGGTAVLQLAFASPLIHIMYGSAFAPSVPVALALTPWFMIGGVNQFLQHAYLASGRPLRAAIASIAGLLVAIGGIAALVGGQGMMGVAYACVTAAVVECVLLGWGLARPSAESRQVA